MKYTAQEIADFLNGTVEGDPNAEVSDFGKIESGSKKDLSFLSNLKYEPYLYTTHCGIVLVNKDFEPQHPVETTLVRVDDAYGALGRLLELKRRSGRPSPGICDSAIVSEGAFVDESAYVGDFVFIDSGAKLGANVVVMPFVYIGPNVHVGDATTIYSHVTLSADTVTGDRCIIHSGAVIGADGFGFAPADDGYHKIPQTGNVVLEDDVEIGANTCIDRASLGSTIIRKGVKIDNLVQIAHNSEVGAHTVMAAQSGIAGSVKLGEWNVLAGQVGVAGHLYTADRVTLAAQTGVISNVKDEGTVLFGSPAVPMPLSMKAMAIHRKLPDIYKQLTSLQEEVDQLKKDLAALK